MQVMLVKDFPQLGNKGTVVNVKNGYFWNYLSPQGVARMATKIDLDRFSKAEAERSAERRKMLSQAEEMVGKLQGGTIEMKAKSTGGGSLYAQIHELEVADVLNAKYKTVLNASDIRFANPVKKTGSHEITVVLSPKHEVKMTLVIEGESE